MLSKIKLFLKKHARAEIAIVIIAVISALCMLPMLKSPLDGHDTDFHLASIYSLATSGELNLFDVKVFDSMAGSFGYGAGIFYPQLLHVVSAYTYRLAAKIGLGLYQSVAISYWMFLSMSGVLMYFLLRKFVKSNKVAVFAALLYVVLPYHLSDILIRDAMAEVGLFIFMPLICLGLYYLAHKNYVKYFIYFILGGVGLINSHLVMTIFIGACLIVFILAHWRIFMAKQNILRLILGSILILVISAPFLAPMIQHRLAGNYTVFWDGYMVNDRTNQGAHIDLSELLIPAYKSRGIIYSLNAVAMVVFILGFFNLKKLKQDRRKMYIWLSIITVACIAFSCGIIHITKWPNALHMIQFAWRLVTIVCFTFTLLLAVALELLPNKSMYLAMVFILIFAVWDYYGIKTDVRLSEGRKINSLSRITKRYNEYYPVSLYQNLDKYEQRRFIVATLNGEAEISKSTGKIPSMKFSVKTSGATLELPRIFYFGYEIKAQYSDGSMENLPYQESPLGFIQFDIQQDADISVRYTGWPVLKISQVIAVTSVIVLVLGVATYRQARYMNHQCATYLAYYDCAPRKAKHKK